METLNYFNKLVCRVSEVRFPFNRMTLASCLIFLISPSFAQVAPETVVRNPVARDLQQLQRDVERYRQSEEIQQMRQQRERIQKEQRSAPPQETKSSFTFRLNGIGHSQSSVLTDEEIAKATAPWIGRDVSMADIKAMLGAINSLYHEKGYVVCEARLRPQRIRNGEIFVTLVEGKTAEVTVSGNEHTRDSFVLGAFNLESGEVANYREMSQDLVHFNMTHDLELRIDIRAGSEPETTDYEIIANEPANWTGTVFSDTLGTRSTGRPRAGVSVTNRSLLGRRDAVTLLGLASEGSKSAMLSYSLPLNSHGTRLLASASYGEVEVVQGPSADGDVEGTSEYYSLRLEHPVFVDADQKWTVYGEWNRQNSTTDFFQVTINDTQVDTYSAGLETILLGDRSVFYGTVGYSHAQVKERTFGERWTQNLLTGNAFWRLQLSNELNFSLSGAWQALMGGDPLSSTQYFYLGHTSGVRGYENNVISAEEGAYLNAQLNWAFSGPETSLFGFFDAGKLGGESSYSKMELASVGAGVTWPLFPGANITGTVAVPLERHLGEELHVNKARFDLSITATW